MSVLSLLLIFTNPGVFRINDFVNMFQVLDKLGNLLTVTDFCYSSAAAQEFHW